LAKFPFIIIEIKMTDNSTQSSAWLLPLEVIELLLFDVHPKVLVSFALTCKELLDYILKNESDSVLINMWGNAYIKYINTETRYSKAQSRKLYLLRAKSLARIARSMKFDIEDEPDTEKRYAPSYDPHNSYDPQERVEIEPEVQKWKWYRQFYYYNVDDDRLDLCTKQYKTLTPSEKLTVGKYSKPRKLRSYKMPNLNEFSTYSISLMAQWLARKATVHCMSDRGEYIQPTLIHDLSRESSLELIILSVIFRQEELYRVLIKEYSWHERNYRDQSVHQEPEFREKYPRLTGAIETQLSERFRDTYTCRIVDWPKVHLKHLNQTREILVGKSKELETMFGLNSSSKQ
jgi:hypothetical protein